MFKIDGKNAFVCDESEFSGVKKIADKVCLDVERVTGKKTAVSAGTVTLEGAVLFATLGKAPLADKLASENGLSDEVSKITGKRECYVFAVKSDKIIIMQLMIRKRLHLTMPCSICRQEWTCTCSDITA